MDFNASTLDEFPLIGYVFNSPLSKLINFAYKSCGYTSKTHYILVNWVNTTFIKAKAAASKEDNSNWWEAMSGPFVY